jgi:hypothetical protein
MNATAQLLATAFSNLFEIINQSRDKFGIFYLDDKYIESWKNFIYHNIRRANVNLNGRFPLSELYGSIGIDASTKKYFFSLGAIETSDRYENTRNTMTLIGGLTVPNRRKYFFSDPQLLIKSFVQVWNSDPELGRQPLRQ